jgi:MYXO-CTERM domain-containing protein
MPAVVDMPGCAQHVNQFSHATGGRRHDLVGANRFVVELLREEYGSSGANVIGDLYFDTAIDAMTELLATATTVELAGPESVDLTVGLDALAVTVTNETGHKLPTGYSEGRITWLQVEATYADTVVWTSGAWDPASGLQRDDQLRTYEAVAEQWSTGTNFHLLLNDHWVVDSRIPPRGLQPNLETDPVGDRYTLQPDGTWPNFDSHSYAFAAAPELFDVTPEDPSDDELLVTVRVQYLINTPEYIDFLASTGSPAGLNVATMFDLAGGATPVTVGQASLAIPIVGFGSVAGTGGTSSGGADTTGGVTSGASTGSVDGTTTTTMPASTTGDADEESGSSGPGTDAEPGGCSCRTASRAPGLGLGLLALVLGTGRRRRRRRRHRA